MQCKIRSNKQSLEFQEKIENNQLQVFNHQEEKYKMKIIYDS